MVACFLDSQKRDLQKPTINKLLDIDSSSFVSFRCDHVLGEMKGSYGTKTQKNDCSLRNDLHNVEELDSLCVEMTQKRRKEILIKKQH